jgi:hypothetical protein
VDVDAGMIWFGADDVTVLGGDFGPGIDENTKIEFATGHPPRNILIDGAVIHDTRIDDDHQECVALWGGSGVTIRNTHIYNCAVFHIWIDAEAGDTIRDVLIEGNLFTQPGPNPPSIGSTVKVGDHGGTLENIVLRGNRVLVDELFVVLGYDDGGSGDVHSVRQRGHRADYAGKRPELHGGRHLQAQAGPRVRVPGQPARRRLTGAGRTAHVRRRRR